MLIRAIDDYYEATYVTGPTHTTLQLALSLPGDEATACITALPPHGECFHGALDPDAIRSAVHAGVAHANRVLHASYHLRRIGYVQNDTPTYVVYQMLAYRMILHHHRVNMRPQVHAPTRQAFEIVTSTQTTEDVWLLEGRAWQDISYDDVLFAVREHTIDAYEVVRLVTYGHDVATLSRMMTGAAYVRASANSSVAPTRWLYR
jgi:hypothetical protein